MREKTRTFTFEKSKWKRQVTRMAGICDRMLLELRIGEVPSIKRLYDLARDVNKLGEQAKVLATEAERLRMQQRVLDDIAHQSTILHIYSSMLYDQAKRLEFPVADYPLFVSTLMPPTVDRDVNEMRESLATVLEVE
jgi:hypothetical protein